MANAANTTFQHFTLLLQVYACIHVEFLNGEGKKERQVMPLLVLLIKVAEHSFQVPMPNSPLLLNYLCIGARVFARVKVNYRSIYSRILAKMCAVAMAMGLVKNKA